MNRFSTNQLTFVAIAVILIVFAELTLFNNGSTFLIILGAILLYFSFSKNKKYLFWSGCFLIFLAILSIWSLRLLIVGVLIYILYKHVTKEQKIVAINTQELDAKIMKNRLIGNISSPVVNYKWEDILMQKFVGDISLDLTETILPAGTSVITIRQFIGKVTIVLPYEIPFRLQYSTLLGEAKILGNHSKRLINEKLIFEDEEAQDAKRNIVIHVATWLGDVEVIRK
ncbi:cell wall-active antibiotics response protein LiaF [Ureibacillus aquaedulcis]|uniref:Cell wall-active antibiotics response protein LiaF n=1 Tax=Ureibacillus aquaedulcis TaxID=3058421 RepID=A0ABT8GRA8_9BACL|nr:cell wall-active antibiotics response protein LiaF [Ureibacillus sp. BA0131]MDN4493938.1 cell wall-active antibiotics response protein LiaF [Ureibacillus sp. BA0131]